jgi:hypothetical protein
MMKIRIVYLVIAKSRHKSPLIYTETNIICLKKPIFNLEIFCITKFPKGSNFILLDASTGQLTLTR